MADVARSGDRRTASAAAAGQMVVRDERRRDVTGFALLDDEDDLYDDADRGDLKREMFEFCESDEEEGGGSLKGRGASLR